MLYRVSTLFCYCFFKIFFALQIKGKDVFPADEPFILASNHLSHLDPPVLAVSCPRKIAFLAKQELFSNKLFRLYLKDVGVISIKRGASDIKSLRLALKTLKTKALLVFPQGTRGGDFAEVSFGVGFLARKSKVPVVAARIYGTDKILPKGAKFFRRGRIRVVFSKVDSVGDDDSYEDITLKVVEAIKKL